MFNNIKKSLFPLLILLSALAISTSAATISIIGLSKLFAGAATTVIIMMAGLEVSKLVAASLLHQYWKKLNFLLKTYLVLLPQVCLLHQLLLEYMLIQIKSYN